MTTYTATEKLEAVQRELRFRRRVYADRVAQGKMKPAAMTFQIGVFEAVEADYVTQAAGERLL